MLIADVMDRKAARVALDAPEGLMESGASLRDAFRIFLESADGELASSLLAIAGVARDYGERFAQSAGVLDGDAR